MAARKVGSGGGRGRLALLLIAFLAISGVVVLRRTYGIRAQRELVALDARRAALVAERLKLESDIRTASSRARLQPIAEQRLGMKVPDPAQVITVSPVAPTP